MDDIDDAVTRVNVRSLTEQDSAVLTEDLAQRWGDVARRQDRGRHLVEQWLEEVVVDPVDDYDFRVRATQTPGGVQTPETRADDYHAVPRTRSVDDRSHTPGVPLGEIGKPLSPSVTRR
ncbi:hypothetical protein Aglo03_15590 [Actinokineospora globicatena]|uniref:Uncharacterized protein n=1 Tax=Actinokineospora globicatena TaxID=103729 RepID=A0A9W6QHV6_9PSEU|nr:hypothetical protein Aglo03_15590 [Actinokineospora globicatena]